MTKEQYNSEPMWWCEKCCSCNITTDYRCLKCGNDDPTAIKMGTVGEYEKAYRKMYIEPPLGWQIHKPYEDLADEYNAQAREVVTYQEAYNNGLKLTKGKPF